MIIVCIGTNHDKIMGHFEPTSFHIAQIPSRYLILTQNGNFIFTKCIRRTHKCSYSDDL